jgi:hypothetical protein
LCVKELRARVIRFMSRIYPLLLLAASARLDLVNEVYRIPPNEWRYVEVGLKQHPGLVSANFTASEAGSQVRLALMRREELERLRNGLPHGVLAVSATGNLGALNEYIAALGDYVVVVDNLGNAPAMVHLRIMLDFSRRGPTVTRLSPQRQLTIVAISFAVFFGIVTFSARRLLRNLKR